MDKNLDKYERAILLCIFRERTNRKSSVDEHKIVNFFDPSDLFQSSENDWNKQLFVNAPDLFLQIKLALNNLVAKGFLEENILADSSANYKLTSLSEDLFINKPSIFQVENKSCMIE